MTEARIDELLDEYMPAFKARPGGWDDVLARAHTTRRRYATLAVVALALLLVPTAVALRSQRPFSRRRSSHQSTTGAIQPEVQLRWPLACETKPGAKPQNSPPRRLRLLPPLQRSRPS